MLCAVRTVPAALHRRVRTPCGSVAGSAARNAVPCGKAIVSTGLKRERGTLFCRYLPPMQAPLAPARAGKSSLCGVIFLFWIYTGWHSTISTNNQLYFRTKFFVFFYLISTKPGASCVKGRLSAQFRRFPAACGRLRGHLPQKRSHRRKKRSHDNVMASFGRGRKARTLDTRFWRPLLYQLSYTPVWWAFGDSNPGPDGYEPSALTN